MICYIRMHSVPYLSMNATVRHANQLMYISGEYPETSQSPLFSENTVVNKPKENVSILHLNTFRFFKALCIHYPITLLQKFPYVETHH